jgi:hypothetical protein
VAMIEHINGIEVVASTMTPEFSPKKHHVFPRSKKKRIRKKYHNDKRNWINERYAIFAIGKMFVHPNNLELIKRGLM